MCCLLAADVLSGWLCVCVCVCVCVCALACEQVTSLLQNSKHVGSYHRSLSQLSTLSATACVINGTHLQCIVKDFFPVHDEMNGLKHHESVIPCI
jgi:hypothetical protein